MWRLPGTIIRWNKCRSAGRRGCCRCGCGGRRRRERRTGGGRCCSSRFRRRWLARLAALLLRRLRGLQLRDNRVGIERRYRGRGEVARQMRYLHGDRQRLVFCQRKRDIEALGALRHRDRTGRLAARAKGTCCIGTGRDRVDGHRDHLRCWLERIHRNGRAAGEAQARDSNHDDITHGPPVILVRRSATVPGATIRGSAVSCNIPARNSHRGSGILVNRNYWNALALLGGARLATLSGNSRM